MFDLFVIGGGSAGLAASKAAAKLGKKVGLADYVAPGFNGTTWGPGGTCVNVGCIPKKLFHIAAQLGDIRQDQGKVGWSGIEEKGAHNWKQLIERVQEITQRFGKYQEDSLKDNGVQYFNHHASFVDNHTIQLDKQQTIKAKDILIAVGSRPKLIPYKNYITSEDLFTLNRPPGKTLVIGGSYVALECAGFLNTLGYQTKIITRGKLLSGFDQQFANLIGDYMQELGIRIHKNTQLLNIDENKVTYQTSGNSAQVENFETILVAIGREAHLSGLNLINAGVKTSFNNRIKTDQFDRTNMTNIYALGDCVDGIPHLTPTAIMAGRKLVKRLYQKSNSLMDYDNVATTIFTPLEYGCIGLSEEEAIKRYSRDNLKIYSNVFRPVTWNISYRNPNICRGKLIVHKDTDKVLGFHYLGPEAAEVTQGFSVAMKMGATKADFDNTVGIHPSLAEEMVQLRNFV